MGQDSCWSSGPRGFESHPRRQMLHPLCRLPIHPTNRTQHPQPNNQLRTMDAKTRLPPLHHQKHHPSPQIHSPKNQPPTTRNHQNIPSHRPNQRKPQSQTNRRPHKILHPPTHPLQQTKLQTNTTTTLHPPRTRSRPTHRRLPQQTSHIPPTNQRNRNTSRRSMEPQMDRHRPRTTNSQHNPRKKQQPQTTQNLPTPHRHDQQSTETVQTRLP